MFRSTNTDEKTNGKLSEDSDESDCKDTLDSSYELCTPIKTRASEAKSKNEANSVTSTRSGRKIKKIQYFDFETYNHAVRDRIFTPTKMKDNMETPVKSSALKELNSLKDELSQLRIASGSKTPTRGRKSVRLSEAASKVNSTPTGKILSPNHTYSKSGRKIKKLQYTENNSDNENDCKVSDKRRQLSINRTPVNNINSTTPIYTRSGRKIKKIQYLEDEFFISPTKNSRKYDKMEVDSSEIISAENNTPGVVEEENNVMDTSSEIFTPSKTKSNNGEPSKLCIKPKNSVSSPVVHTKSGRKVKKKKYIYDTDEESQTDEESDPDEEHKQTEETVNAPKDDSTKTSDKTKSNNGKSTKLCIKPKESVSPPIIHTKSGRKVKKKKYIYDTDEESQTDEESDPDEEHKQTEETVNVPKDDNTKSSALYEDDNEVGEQIFCFQRNKNRHSMLDKAMKSASKTNNLLKTPKSSNKSNAASNPKTPYNMRKKIKRGIAKEISRQTIDAALEDSGSDFIPTSSSSSEESDLDEDSDDTDNDSVEMSGIMPLDATIEPLKEKLLNRKSKAVNNNFMFTPEDYFDHKNLRTITSNHTLGQLKTPRLNQFQLNEILTSMGNRHEKFLTELHQENEAMFPRWLYSMNEGFNILVYGVGSKKKLLNNFHKQFLSRCPVAVVNGYFPGLLLKDIFDCITNDVLKLRSVPTQPHDIVEFIGTKLRIRNNKLFLLIHNIDGPSLRCEKIQTVLAHLAADPNIHLVATVDHINSPLLWDQNKLSQFNFIWEDGSSFLPYLNETSYENSLMVQQSGGIALSGLKNIFKSLNSNSRKIFKLLLAYQLQENSNKSQGMLFSELYRECRNSFLVSSDLALRTQLTEFFDHELVKWKKDNEHLIIPLDNSILKKFQNYLETQND